MSVSVGADSVQVAGDFPPRLEPETELDSLRWPTVCSPAAAAIVAIGTHSLVPNYVVSSSEPMTAEFYPQGLLATLLFAVAFAMLALVWRRFRPLAQHVAPLFAAAVLAVGIWELVTLKLALLPLPYFPGPEPVLQGMFDDRWVLLESTYHSLKLLLSGYALGVCTGIISGVLMGWFRQVRYWGMPIMRVVGPIPATAFVPLAMIMFNEAFYSGTALIALTVWFPVTMLTTSGIANVPASYFDVARTLGAGRGYLVFRVAIPAAMPSIFIGLFMGLSAAFLTLIVAETVGVRSGLGWYLKWQQGYLEYAKVYASLVIMAVFFSGIMTVLFKVRDRVLTWQKGVIRW